MLSTPAMVLRRLMQEAWNEGNVEVLERTHRPDCCSYDINTGEVLRRGLEAHKEYILETRRVFPDLKVEVMDVVAMKDNMALRWVAAGTQNGEWLGAAPSGRYLVWGGITLYETEDSRIKAEWVAADHHSVWQQLGIIGRAREANG